jgi:hypothetical protein
MRMKDGRVVIDAPVRSTEWCRHASKKEKIAVGERRSGIERRSGVDRRSAGTNAPRARN